MEGIRILHVVEWPGYRNAGFLSQISQNWKSNPPQPWNLKFSVVNFQEEKKRQNTAKTKNLN